MSAVSDEILLIDVQTMQVVDASHSVLKKIQGDLASVCESSLEKLLGPNAPLLREFASRYQQALNFDSPAEQDRNNIKLMEIDEYLACTVQQSEGKYIFLIKNDISSQKHAIEALDESESRFQALVNNTPGLVFEFQLDLAGEFVFTYLSDNCKVLLGLDPDELKQNPRKLLNMINAEDLDVLQDSIKVSALECLMFNWEGRVWIDDWQDTKWINVRAIPRRLSNGQLHWNGMMTNITQSRNEKFEIEESRRRLAELSAHSEQVKEQERRRIAREIHDDLGGNLTTIKIGLASLINKIDKNQTILIEKAKNLEALVDDTFEVAHRISSDLRPNILDLGIVAALEWQSHEFEKQMGIACTFVSNRTDVSVSIDEAITLFRICQEAMSNIAKHAKATQVKVELRREVEGLVMTIKDNGVGIKTGDVLKPNSFGLRGMTERVTAVNGQISIENQDKSGVLITVKLPLNVNLGIE